jgi:shikimate kinase
MTGPSAGPRIVLVGPMGVGKTTVGELLAERLGCTFRDTDADIVAGQGREIADIFIEDGEGHFRELERAAVRTAVAEHDGVLALGGGAILDAGTREVLGAHPVVYLSMAVDEAVKRTGLNVARPLLTMANPRKQWREPMERAASCTRTSPAWSSPPTDAPPKRSPKRSWTHWS